MKTEWKRTALWVAVLLTMGLSACSKGNEDSMKQQQLELRSKLENSIAEIDRESDEIKGDLVSASETARETLNAQIDRLKDVRSDLSSNLDKMGDTTADHWDEFHRSVDRSLDNAQRVLRDVKEQLTRK